MPAVRLGGLAPLANKPVCVCVCSKLTSSKKLSNLSYLVSIPTELPNHTCCYVHTTTISITSSHHFPDIPIYGHKETLQCVSTRTLFIAPDEVLISILVPDVNGINVAGEMVANTQVQVIKQHFECSLIAIALEIRLMKQLASWSGEGVTCTFLFIVPRNWLQGVEVEVWMEVVTLMKREGEGGRGG